MTEYAAVSQVPPGNVGAMRIDKIDLVCTVMVEVRENRLQRISHGHIGDWNTEHSDAIWCRVDPFAVQNGRNRPQGDAAITPQRLRLSVSGICFPLMLIRYIGAVLDLPDADESWTNIVYAPQLWQLIHAKLADNAANPRDPRVTLHFKGNAALVVRLALERVFQRLCIDDHRVKFGEWKLAPPTSNTYLPEEHWALIGEFNQDHDDEKEGSSPSAAQLQQ
jgi:hypothetical protein